MKNWQSILISPETPILKTVEIIDSTGLQIAFVVEEERKLLGAVTDGDIRRGILKGISLQSPVRMIMNSKPIVASPDETQDELLVRMRAKCLPRMPVVDANGCILGVHAIEDLLAGMQSRENWVLIMAGGLGARLRPLTNNCPKPLLQVGNRPVLETILLGFIESGFSRFFFSVNYKAEMIEEYFGDGSKWGIKIHYLHEEQKLGTAGAVSLLPEPPSLPLLVMNGDLLTKVNFHHLLAFHAEQQAKATMCVREYDLQVPYGVVKLAKESITQIDEKPIHKFFVNAGIYVLDPEVVTSIPKNTQMDMPSLFNRLTLQETKTAAFPVREYWLDIGHLDDLERANGEFSGTFHR